MMTKQDKRIKVGSLVVVRYVGKTSNVLFRGFIGEVTSLDKSLYPLRIRLAAKYKDQLMSFPMNYDEVEYLGEL